MVEIANSFDLLVWLKNQNLLDKSPPFWWPNYGSFEVIISCFLTQNTKWQNVEKSLANLHSFLDDDISLKKICSLDSILLSRLIAPSGFKNQKAFRIQKLCTHIQSEFGDFETFTKQVTRDWLIAQKGIGQESADAILCYACKKAHMVVDSYTAKLLKNFGYDFESYAEIKEWLMAGVNENFDKIQLIYNRDIDENELYARFHGKIVEYSKLSKNNKA